MKRTAVRRDAKTIHKSVVGDEDIGEIAHIYNSIPLNYGRRWFSYVWQKQLLIAQTFMRSVAPSFARIITHERHITIIKIRYDDSASHAIAYLHPIFIHNLQN